MNKFPVTPEALTTSWLTRAMGSTVNALEIEPMGAGGGLLGLVARLHLTGDDVPSTVIGKFPTQTPENRAVAETYDMYGREYRFYTQVAPSTPLRVPECYFAAFDDTSGNVALLLEDLKDYRLGDQVTGCSVDEAHQVIRGIASLHRNTWQPDHFTEIKQHDMPYQREGMIGGYQVGWPNALELFPQFFDDELIRIASTMPDHVNRLLDEIHDGPLVIAHGDVRLDNIFFTDDDIAMVDFQAVCKAAPEHDLAYFVTQSLPDDVRQAEDWHKVYHDHLTAEGIDYDLTVSAERYRLCATYFLCYSVIIAGTLNPSNERGKQLAETLLGNSVRSLRELNAFELIDRET